MRGPMLKTASCESYYESQGVAWRCWFVALAETVRSDLSYCEARAFAWRCCFSPEPKLLGSPASVLLIFIWMKWAELKNDLFKTIHLGYTHVPGFLKTIWKRSKNLAWRTKSRSIVLIKVIYFLKTEFFLTKLWCHYLHISVPVLSPLFYVECLNSFSGSGSLLVMRQIYKRGN
jgi:hypothetical protein